MSDTENACCAEVTVLSAMGLHARPAAQIAGMVSKSGVNVLFSVADDPARSADASSVLSLLILAAVKGTVLKIQADGPGARELLTGIVEYFQNGFNEI